jgi:hypothetical protein
MLTRPRLLVSLLLMVPLAGACSDREFPGQGPGSPQTDGGPRVPDYDGSVDGVGDCGAVPPPSAPCVADCSSAINSVGYICSGGEWVCPPGTIDLANCTDSNCELPQPVCQAGCDLVGSCLDWECVCEDPGCSGSPDDVACVTECGSDVIMGGECTGIAGSYQCASGLIDASTCPPETCWGTPPGCCDGTEAECDGQGNFVCASGMLSAGCSCPAVEPPPKDSATPQAIRFSFAARSGWLVVQGQECASLQIERTGPGASFLLAQGVGYQTVCEGPAPPPSGPTQLLSLAGGATDAVRWAGTYLQLYQDCVNCADRGFPAAGLQLTTSTVTQPALPGHYRVTFAVIDDPSAFGCQVAPDGTASCPPGSSFVDSGQALQRCPGARTISVEFDLSGSGDVEVVVP